MNVHDSAQAYQTTKREYHTAFEDHFSHQVAALPDDQFWQIQPILVREVIRFRFCYGRTNGVEQAARELFRKPLANGFSINDEPRISYSLEEAMQFAKSWRHLRGRLYGPLFDVVEDRGDDAYGDFLDALPLAGRDVIQRALSREYGNQRQLKQAIQEATSDCPQLGELIVHGEIYVGMSLRDAARDSFALSIREPDTY